MHGNEILGTRVTGYDKGKTFRQSDHTLANIDSAIRSIFAPEEVADGILTELAGYMVLDALIGNTDRHHKNWGLLQHQHPGAQALSLSVAPSFDHASSLGRELLDERRAELLAGGRVESYIGKGRGGIFRDPEDRHGENPLRLVQVAARAYPAFFRPAVERVAALNHDVVDGIIESIPDDRASQLAKQFAKAMIFSAQASLIETLK